MDAANPVNNRTRDRQIDDFDNHSYDYSPNWTPLGPITIINCKRKKNRTNNGTNNGTPCRPLIASRSSRPHNSSRAKESSFQSTDNKRLLVGLKK